jgi:hypothetical protein
MKLMSCEVRRVVASLFLAGLTVLPPALRAQTNGVLREFYAGIGNGSIAAFTNSPTYPNSPTAIYLESSFDAPVNIAENYGQRMRALLLPPVTGDYVFWIATDDQGALLLSTDENPATRRQIAYVNTWTGWREWTKETNQQSAPISLTAGQRYYIEALQTEGGGGDNLTVRWQLPGGAIEDPIPNSRVIAHGLGPGDHGAASQRYCLRRRGDVRRADPIHREPRLQWKATARTFLAPSFQLHPQSPGPVRFAARLVRYPIRWVSPPSVASLTVNPDDAAGICRREPGRCHDRQRHFPNGGSRLGDERSELRLHQMAHRSSAPSGSMPAPCSHDHAARRTARTPCSSATSATATTPNTIPTNSAITFTTSVRPLI